MNNLVNPVVNVPATTFKSYVEWFIVTAFVFFQFFLQTSASVMSDAWVRDFNLNHIQLSRLSASFFYTYVLMQIPIGILYDKYPAKKLLILAGIVLAIGCFMLAVVPQFKGAVLARFLMGIGSSFGYIGMLKVVINIFPKNKFALMLGIGESIAMAVVTLGVIALAYFLQLYSWRVAIFACGIFALLLVGAIIFYMDTHAQQNNSQSITFAAIFHQVLKLLVNKQVILCSIYGFFMFALINAFTSLWGVSFITNTYGFSHEVAAKMVSAALIGLGVGAPLNGIFSKKNYKHTKVMFVYAGLITLAMSMIIFMPYISQTMLFILLFLAGLFCSGYIQCISVIKDSVNNNIQATALATANMLIMAGAPILQILIGILLNTNCFGLATTTAANYRCALAILPLGMLSAFVICRYIKEPTKYAIKREF